MNQARANAPEDQAASRKRRKQFFIIFMIIFLSLIVCAIILVFAALKHQIESESLSANPTEAIRSACKLTPFYDNCVESMSSLNNSRHDRIHASDVLRLSIDAAFHKLLAIHQLPQEVASRIKNKKVIRPVLSNCQNLFNNAFIQLNRSLIMITKNDLGLDDEIMDYHDAGVMKGLRVFVLQAKKNVDACIDILDREGTTMQRGTVEIKNAKERIQQAEIYMMNSLAILENSDSIREMFVDPSFRSLFASLVLNENYVLSVVLFSQYLFLVFLVGFLLRVFV